MNRKSFLAYAVAMLTGTVLAQHGAVTKDGKTTVCDTEIIKCPLGHDSCKEINAYVAVGTGNYNAPDVGALPNYTMFCCTQCGVLFARK